MNNAVTVVGAGPTGLMLACELGLAGVRTTLVDRLPTARVESMGSAINPAVVGLLDQRGIMGLLSEDGFAWPAAHFAQMDLDPVRLGDRHPVNFILPQAKLELRLAERAAELGVTIRRGTEVVDLTQDETGVTAVIQSGDGTERIRSEYLVGCDGAQSTVRTLAGMRFPGTEAPFYGIVGEFDVEPGDPLYQRIGNRVYRQGLLAVAPSAPNVLRVITGEFDVTPPDQLAPVCADELYARIWRILSPDLTTDTVLTTGTVRWLSRWNHVTRQAESYRQGRLFLAGDAAHVHFPLGGQAMSTGIEDAVNLGWKLAAAIHGWAPAGLLDTYHSERHPVGARACLTTRAQVALLQMTEEVEALRTVLEELIRFDTVNEFLVKLVGGLDVRYVMEDPESAGTPPHPLTGLRLANVAFEAASGETDAARLLRRGRGVLLDLTNGAGSPRPDVSGWADRVDVVTAKPTPQIDASNVLLRPDGRVAWATDRPAAAGLSGALRTWFGDPA